MANFYATAPYAGETPGSGGNTNVNIFDSSGNVLNSNGSGALDVAVTSFPGTVTVVQPTAANLNATVVGSGNFTVVQPSGAALHVDVDNFPATQPVSGTVTVVQPTAANLNATVTGTVAATQSGTWNITNISGTVSLPTGASTAANQTNVQSAIGTSATTAITVQGSATGVALPISGTVTATVTGVSTSANQTNGTQKTQVVDGANATVGPVQTISGTNYLPVVLASSGTTGSAVPARSIQIAGSDGTNLRTLSTTTNGFLNVNASVTTGGSAGPANAPVYNIYSSTNITTAAYTQLIASTTSTTNYLDIFDSSGQAMILGVGAPGSEVIQGYVPPGGDQIHLLIPSGSRVAYKALTANATSGYLIMSLYQ